LWRADFGFFRDVFGRIPWGWALQEKRVQERHSIFKHHFLQAQEWCILMSKKLGRESKRPAWVNKEHMSELSNKQEIKRRGKQGQATWNEYRDVVRVSRSKLRKAKAHLEFNLVKNIKDKKKGFFKYINDKRPATTKWRSNPGEGTQKRLTYQMPSMLFVFIFNMDDRQRGSELEDHNGKNDQLPVNPEIVWDLLLQLDPYNSIGPDGIHSTILKELADVIAKPLSIFKQSRESKEVPADWKLTNIVPIFKKNKKENLKNYRPVSLTSVPGKVTEIILGGTEKHLKDNAVIGHSQHGFMRAKSCLSNPTSFYDKVTHPADQGKPVDVTFLDFSKAFDTVSHSILP
ncbi:PO22 protein, partial [Falcunculus frontatus]|nr:PO22 protein [Falcunculus frontatus]